MDDGEHGAGRLVFKYLEDKGFVNITVVITKQLKGRMASVAKRSDLINKSIEDACNQLTAVNKLPPTLKPPPRQDSAPPLVNTQPQTVSTSLASSQAGDNVTAGPS